MRTLVTSNCRYHRIIHGSSKVSVRVPSMTSKATPLPETNFGAVQILSRIEHLIALAVRHRIIRTELNIKLGLSVWSYLNRMAYLFWCWHLLPGKSLFARDLESQHRSISISKNLSTSSNECKCRIRINVPILFGLNNRVFARADLKIHLVRSRQKNRTVDIS